MRKWVKWSPEALFVMTGLLAATSACASSPANLSLASAGMPPGGAQAGNAGTDPAAAGASAHWGAERDLTPKLDPATPTKYGACVAYAKAQCQRRAVDCGQRDRDEDPCAWSIDRCPDTFFSPGSSWTVASLLSCAEAWKTFPCDELRQHKRPDCAMPKGTRQQNEPCLFASQCASNTCTDRKQDGTGIPGYSNCGVCGERSELGGPCDVAGYVCGPEFTCGASKKCEKRASVGVVGASCDDNSTCGGYGISCREDPSDGVKRCLQYPEAGESCAVNSCADGYVCTDDGVCAPGPAEGETCGAISTAQCSVGLVCTGRFEDPPNTCIAGHKLGENCTGSPRLAPRGNCEVGLRCDCGELDCDRVSGICRQVGGEGESCTDQNSLCAPGTICVDDKCSALESQPDLMALCPQ